MPDALPLKVAVLSPVAWRTPPRHYGPWEQIASALAEGLVDRGLDVTLFATADSHTRGRLSAVVPRGYEEDPGTDAKVAECLHIAALMERAAEFDLIHNHFDFLPLTYSRLVPTPMVTTIHGFSSPKIIPVYQRYNDRGHYVSISHADRSPLLRYTATVYHGLDPGDFPYDASGGDYLLYFGRIHPDKGTWEAVRIALAAGRPLLLAGIIQDRAYFEEKIRPLVDGEQVRYLGAVGPQDRPALLGGAHCLLHPIHFEEPFGLSVAEAMMCGTPVMAFCRGAMPELIRDGETGFLVNSVEEALEKLPLVEKLDRAACRRWAEERFSRDRMITDYLEVYQAVLAGHAPPS